jgi:hypothetical protein
LSAGHPLWEPAMNATGTITMTMRELDRYKVTQDAYVPDSTTRSTGIGFDGESLDNHEQPGPNHTIFFKTVYTILF